MKNETPLVVNARDSSIKESTDKKQEISITEEKATATQSTLETKEVVTHGKEKQEKNYIRKNLLCLMRN